MLSLRLGVAVRPSCTAGAKYSRMPRQLLSSLAPPRWHSSMTMKSKKSGGSALRLQLCANFSAFVLGAVDIDVKVAVLEALELFVGEPGPGRNVPLAF